MAIINKNISRISRPCPRRKRAAARRAAKEGKADAKASVEGGEGGAGALRQPKQYSLDLHGQNMGISWIYRGL